MGWSAESLSRTANAQEKSCSSRHAGWVSHGSTASLEEHLTGLHVPSLPSVSATAGVKELPWFSFFNLPQRDGAESTSAQEVSQSEFPPGHSGVGEKALAAQKEEHEESHSIVRMWAAEHRILEVEGRSLPQRSDRWESFPSILDVHEARAGNHHSGQA